jgi:hypothetical protein
MVRGCLPGEGSKENGGETHFWFLERTILEMSDWTDGDDERNDAGSLPFKYTLDDQVSMITPSSFN